jgi:negative regulator of replication initiation
MNLSTHCANERVGEIYFERADTCSNVAEPSIMNERFNRDDGGYSEIKLEEFGRQTELISKNNSETDDRLKTKTYPLDISTVESIEHELRDIRMSRSFTERTNKFLTHLLQSPLLLQISSLRRFDKLSGNKSCSSQLHHTVRKFCAVGALAEPGFLKPKQVPQTLYSNITNVSQHHCVLIVPDYR